MLKRWVLAGLSAGLLSMFCAAPAHAESSSITDSRGDVQYYDHSENSIARGAYRVDLTGLHIKHAGSHVTTGVQWYGGARTPPGLRIYLDTDRDPYADYYIGGVTGAVYEPGFTIWVRSSSCHDLSGGDGTKRFSCLRSVLGYPREIRAYASFFDETVPGVPPLDWARDATRWTRTVRRATPSSQSMGSVATAQQRRVPARS